MTGPRPGGPDEGIVAAVLKLTDLAARVERVEQSAAQRIEELAASCAEALAQVAGLREEAGTLGARADGIEHKLAEVSALLARMSAQIDALTATPEPASKSAGTGPPGRGCPAGWSPGAARMSGRSASRPPNWQWSTRGRRCSRCASGIPPSCAPLPPNRRPGRERLE